MTDSATTSAGAGSTPAGDHRRALADMLRCPRYEVLPLDGTAELVQAHVPRVLPVTVTASPKRGIDATLALTETLARLGYRVVPHLSARLVRDEAHLTEILQGTDAANVQDVFVVSGDLDRPTGAFADSLTLLTAIHRLRQSGTGHRLEQVGITGYPEGHPVASAAELTEVLHAKAPLSTYVVTQLCFDAAAVSSWVTSVRRAGLKLPVHVGVPGAVDQLKLLRIAQRIGVRASARFARKQRGMSQLVQPGGYRPDRLVQRLAGNLGERDRVAGLHVYTFGDVAATEQWRQRTLDRLGRAHHG